MNTLHYRTQKYGFYVAKITYEKRDRLIEEFAPRLREGMYVYSSAKYDRDLAVELLKNYDVDIIYEGTERDSHGPVHRYIVHNCKKERESFFKGTFDPAELVI